MTITSTRKFFSLRIPAGSFSPPSRGRTHWHITPICVIALAALAFCGFNPGIASADLMVTGQFDSPADGTLSAAGGTFVDSSTAPFASGTLQGNLITTVYSGDPANPFVTPSDPDALSFVYTIQSTGTEIIETLDVENWGNLLLNVGFDQTTPGDQPYYDQRFGPVTGNFVEWGFAVINPGESSAQLIVDTPATQYTGVQASVQDGENAAVTSFAVYAPGGIITPEPSSVVMMLLGLVGLLAVVRGRGR